MGTCVILFAIEVYELVSIISKFLKNVRNSILGTFLIR